MPCLDNNSSPNEIKNIIFDLDGTLIDSAPSILRTIKKVLDQFSYIPTRSLDPNLIGPPLKEILQVISGESDSERLNILIESFKTVYDNDEYSSSIVYSGIDKMLANLARDDKNLHIATNKRLAPTERIIRYFNWDQYFQDVYAIDSVASVNPSKGGLIQAMLSKLELKTDNCVYIGDRVEDCLAANENSVLFVYVNWGYGPSLNNIKDNYVVNNPNELTELLCSKHSNCAK